MIISASRRTDIPAYYSDWFYNRIQEGFVCVRNPMNFHQVSRISLSPDVVDGIVFWTKNPRPLMSRLEELRAYPDPIRKRRGTGCPQQKRCDPACLSGTFPQDRPRTSDLAV